MSPTVDGYQVISFRGRTDPALPHLRHTAVSQALVETTQHIGVATDNVTTVGLFAVIGTLGRALGEHSSRPAEKEVVFMPATMFLVLVVTHVDRARRGPDVSGFTPGKFQGGFA